MLKYFIIGFFLIARCCADTMDLISPYDDIKYLHDLTLDQAEMIAVENNNKVNAVRELFLKANQGKLNSISKWLPEIQSMTLMYGLQKVSPVTRAKSSFETQLSLTQSIISTDKYYDVKIAALIVQQLQLLLNAAIIDALFEIRTAYYQVILDIEMIKAAKEKIDLLTMLAKRMEDRHQIGTSILYSVNQSKVAIANATTTYYEMIKRRKIDLDAMVSILGFTPGSIDITFATTEIPVDEITELKEKLNKMQDIFNKETIALNERIFKGEYPLSEELPMKNLFTTSEMHSWEDLALKYQPNLKVYENYVQIADKEVSKRKGDYFPKLDFNVNYGGNSTTVENFPSSSFGNQHMEWAVGIQVNWLIFDGLGRKYRLREAKCLKRSKEFAYRQEIQNTYFDVRKKIFEIEESVANYVTADANVKLAEQTVTLANDQVDVGYATIFDYQVTVNGFIQAVNSKYQARYELLKAYYGLRHATGIDLASYNQEIKDGSKY
jgi:outer membrane protein TolC